MENQIAEFESVLESLNELGDQYRTVDNDILIAVRETQSFQKLQTALNLLGKKIDEIKDNYDSISYRESHHLATGSNEY